MSKMRGMRLNGSKDNPNDRVYTPPAIAEICYKSLPPIPSNALLLDPFRGKGAFYDLFPEGQRDWCEIDDSESRDFFDYNKHVDWIISNPPYSILDDVLDHSFEIADNVCYLVPLGKIFKCLGRLNVLFAWGGIRQVGIIGASRCGFPFGFPCGFFWMQKGYTGDTHIFMYEPPKKKN